jgi:excisionase family DNA binding protein
MSIVPGYETLLTPAEVARLAHVCAKTVYRAIARDDLAASKLGSVYRIRLADYENWLERSRCTPAAPAVPLLRRRTPERSDPGTYEALRSIEADAV